VSLPPEVKEHMLKECLSKFGEVKSIRDELWTSAYKYKVYNGIRIVEMKLKQGLPSHIFIAGNDALISYDGQPPTCYRRNETGHQQIECPRRKPLDPTVIDRLHSTWAGIVSNMLQAVQPDISTHQTNKMHGCKAESISRSLENTTDMKSHMIPQGL